MYTVPGVEPYPSRPVYYISIKSSTRKSVSISKQEKEKPGLKKPLNRQLRAFVGSTVDLDKATGFKLLLPLSGFIPGQDESDTGHRCGIYIFGNYRGGREGPSAKCPVEDIVLRRWRVGLLRFGVVLGVF